MERKKELLENQINSKINHVSKKYNVSSRKIVASMNSGTLWNDETGLDILDIVLFVKEKKMRKAEQRGYAEARELYESKIQTLKSELSRLKEDGNNEIKNLLDQISRIHDAIAEEEMKIAELNLLA